MRAGKCLYCFWTLEYLRISTTLLLGERKLEGRLLLLEPAPEL